MHTFEHMVEQHIREYEARLKHVDQLVERAKATTHPQAHKELQELIPQRDQLAGQVEQMRLKSLDHWREEELAQAGPMGIWDSMAQQLEALIERFEK